LLAVSLSALMSQAAHTHGVDVGRISFKGTADAMRQWAVKMSEASPEDLPRLHQRLLSMIARDLVPLRPDRREPRATKRRPKYYARLIAPRA
jgi:hypothetical protein